MARCVKCKGDAVITLRSKNASFCYEHFVEHFLRQVYRMIKKFRMFEPGGRVLVAVSGGKDSIALWDALLSLGYKAEGVHIDLGLPEYSEASRAACEEFARTQNAKLYLFSVVDTYGVGIKDIAHRNRRATCSVCGAIKRYITNGLVKETGHEVVAMGHNLDDEAAALLGNLLGWQEGYLARQNPRLPANELGFPARVKPLVRLGELETKAYCDLKGLPYAAGGCPLAKGATSLFYKEVMNTIEERMPGTKARFLFGFLEKEQKRFHDKPIELRHCQICGQPTGAEICVF